MSLEINQEEHILFHKSESSEVGELSKVRADLESAFVGVPCHWVPEEKRPRVHG